MSDRKIALISGGASGIGLATAEALALKGWAVHICDIDKRRGDAISEENSNVVYHETDVSSWPSLSSTFDAVVKAEGHIDFVLANAGILEKGNFYKTSTLESDEQNMETNGSICLPPTLPFDESSLDINIKGTIRTVFLAQHYFRESSRKKRECVLIVTSSIAGIYGQEMSPLYSVTKGALITLVRAVAAPESCGIRTYAICPGSVRTNFASKEMWDTYPQEYLTPMSKITETVEMLITGDRMEDSGGKTVDGHSNNGLVVEVFGTDTHFREPPAPWSRDLQCTICVRHQRIFPSLDIRKTND
ncbi:hypothetical protein GGR57DRAFT_514332 [Xylariaceae sp. FL1272]|nr:hypothetical protein GGR57DRAFT_514332 [Xylariaceae sp. FL1272]